jgi:hypothetical protein
LDRVVPLGQIVRQHGLTKDGFIKWKADLFVPGGEVLKNAKRIFLFPSLSTNQLEPKSPDELDATEVVLQKPVEALGAKWGSAPSVLITLPDDDFNPLQLMLGMLRGDFPEPADFYICDLLGKTLGEGTQATHLIKGIFNASQIASIESWIVKIQDLSEASRIAEIPLQLLLNDPAIFMQIQNGSPLIKIPELSQWIENFSDQGEVADDLS